MKRWIFLLWLLGIISFFPGCLGGGAGSEGIKTLPTSAGQAEGTAEAENPVSEDPVEVSNEAPIAHAGIDQTIPVGGTASLDGSSSSDPNGDLLSYQWQVVCRPIGSIASLSDSNHPNPTFSPDRPGDYTVQLVVIDSKGLASQPDTVRISTFNSAPVADAGPDQSFGASGATIYLGGKSYDPDGDPISFSWSIKTKPPGSMAALSDPTSPTPYFVVDILGDYTIELTVTDPWDASKKDSVKVSFANVRPLANAGGNATGTVGQTIYLDGSASHDANGDSLTYRWSFSYKPDGSTATLAKATSVAPYFVPDLSGTYVVSLVVNDGRENSHPSSVTITVIQTVSPVTVKLMQAIDLVHTLDKSTFKNANMRNSLTHKINAVIQTIEQGPIGGALGQLGNDVLQKMNGCAESGAPDANDWIITCEAQGRIYPLIQEAILALQRH